MLAWVTARPSIPIDPAGSSVGSMPRKTSRAPICATEPVVGSTFPLSDSVWKLIPNDSSIETGCGNTTLSTVAGPRV